VAGFLAPHPYLSIHHKGPALTAGFSLQKLHCDVAGYETFEAYCRAEWDMGRNYAYKLMSSSAVIDNVYQSTQKPTSETQVRPLTKIKDPEWRRCRGHNDKAKNSFCPNVNTLA